ncbi:hypothetical protein PCANC_09484 [Puccinia coronata f. sp. avenae]|nr:hypothetical protein PCANC_09484 [Puccinia coronata f. sp. avenae]
MANVPSPGLLRSIRGLGDLDLNLKIRTAGIVVDRSDMGSSIVLKSNSSNVLVDCAIPMEDHSLSNYLPLLSDRIIVLGYLHQATPQETRRHETFEFKYTIEAVLIKKTPGLNLEEWEESIDIN